VLGKNGVDKKSYILPMARDDQMKRVALEAD
jgi:hypothetical protein